MSVLGIPGLQIVDLSPAAPTNDGRPGRKRSGSYSTANIYNFQQIRKETRNAGLRNSPAAQIPKSFSKAYKQWGLDLPVARFNAQCLRWRCTTNEPVTSSLARDPHRQKAALLLPHRRDRFAFAVREQSAPAVSGLGDQTFGR
jgi:hypothetical protein